MKNDIDKVESEWKKFYSMEPDACHTVDSWSKEHK